MTDISEQAHPGAYVADRLRAGARVLAEIKAIFDADIAGMDDLNAACRGYKDVKDAYDWFDRERKDLFAKLEQVSRETIPSLLEEEGVSSLTLDYGEGIKYRFTKNQRLSASMLDKDAGMEWLRSHGGGDLIQPTVNSSALSSFAKEYVGTSGKDLPEDVFKVSTLIVTSVTKAK